MPRQSSTMCSGPSRHTQLTEPPCAYAKDPKCLAKPRILYNPSLGRNVNDKDEKGPDCVPRESSRSQTCGVDREQSRKSLVEVCRPSVKGGDMHVARSRKMFEPFDHLDFWRALIGSSYVVAFLVCNKSVHIPVRQGDFILVLLAEDLFFGHGRWGEF